MEETKEKKDREQLCSVILLRHAQSKANQIHADLRLYDDETVYKEIFKIYRDFDQSIRDAELSDFGVQQCIDAQAGANALNVHTVFCSPLRRALETAYHVFKTHPNFENIKFIVLPDMRECLNISSDIPINIIETEKRFRDLIPQIDFSEFNKFSDKVHYFLFNFDKSIYHKIFENITENREDCCGTNAFDLLVEYALPFHESNFESLWNVYDRTVRVKSFISEYCRTNSTVGKVILVGHGIFFRIFTGKWRQQKARTEQLTMPDESIILDNLQFYEYSYSTASED